jgi:tripartite ATP-independent transporter DctP family solute receptor
MKRLRTVLAILVVMALALDGCGTGFFILPVASAQSGESFEIKIAHNSSETNPIHLGYKEFKRIAEEKSGGRFKVNIFPNAQLGSGDEANADMVKNGVVQMSAVPTYTLAGLANITEYKLFDVPYLFGSSEQIYKMMEGEIGQELLERLQVETGIKGNPPYVQGWVKISTKKKPVTTPDDVKGLKIRTSNSDFYIEMVKSWGANPTPMNYGEVFTALQQGTVDGIVTTTPLYVPDRLYEVQGYMATVNPVAIVHIPIVNNKFYERLPEDLKPVFDEAMNGYIKAVRQYHADAEASAISELRELGMEVNELTPEQRAVFADLSAYIKDSKADDIGREFLARVIATMN